MSWHRHSSSTTPPSCHLQSSVMFRSFARISALPRLRCARFSSQSTKDEEIQQARTWLAQFDAETIPKNICEFSFSRSSGPGGQNVNKVNSKATLKVPLSSLRPVIPKLLWSTIATSRYCSDRGQELVIQSDDSRKQQENVQKCLLKLNDLIAQAGRDNVPGETSDAQRSRVKNLQKASNESRLKNKKFHSDKKSSRRSSGRPDY
ncbi:hypothetical protein K461DRAFT_184686 [Myriangium duriaei CBS 260.36]|uniref:Prokaryotic-type class I peptide chain release factors domain-containing protein n=1 Tax=Myriangium duriaei CBS 260.36 TaxID=1168546 RepID=A0A9P4MKK9_9PEZI|nr:hypothetical protein K461DRAFT_184686 [Myriangium duriaei CBS 260.36]